jgi:hypothetical protein
MDSDIYYYAVSTSMPSTELEYPLQEPDRRGLAWQVIFLSLTIFFAGTVAVRMAAFKRIPYSKENYDRRQPGFRVLDT